MFKRKNKKAIKTEDKLDSTIFITPFTFFPTKKVVGRGNIQELKALTVITDKSSGHKDVRLTMTGKGAGFYLINIIVLLILLTGISVVTFFLFNTRLRDFQFYMNAGVLVVFIFFLFDRIKLVYASRSISRQKKEESRNAPYRRRETPEIYKQETKTKGKKKKKRYKSRNEADTKSKKGKRKKNK